MKRLCVWAAIAVVFGKLAARRIGLRTPVVAPRAEIACGFRPGGVEHSSHRRVQRSSLNDPAVGVYHVIVTHGGGRRWVELG